MENIIDFVELSENSLLAFAEKFMSALPNIIAAFSLLIIGWFIAKILSWIAQKILKGVKLDELFLKMNLSTILEKSNINLTPTQLVGKFFFWIIFLLFFISASDTLGLQIVSITLSDLIAYLPKLFSGLVVFILGVYIATFCKNALIGFFNTFSIALGNILSSLVFYIIMIIITVTSLEQIGINTALFASNINIILGILLLGFSLAFGLGSKSIITSILSGYYSQGIFNEGQKISINDNIVGTIEKIDKISIIIVNDAGEKIVYPLTDLMSQKVKILK